MPQRPGTSGSFFDAGQTQMSQVLVPMILTKRPVSTPEPTPPRWASKAPTATAIPGRRPSFFAHSLRQAAGGDVGGVGLLVEAVAELAQARVELGQERLGRAGRPSGR